MVKNWTQRIEIVKMIPKMIIIDSARRIESSQGGNIEKLICNISHTGKKFKPLNQINED